jgi:hypothetical protein
MQINNQTALPAHPYNHETGMGIRLENGTAVVMEHGQPVSKEVKTTLDTPAYWLTQQFVKDFSPDWWWWYDTWTGNVRGHIQENGLGGITSGTLNTNHETLTWAYRQGVIRVTMPKHTSSYNFPLRFLLSEFCYGLVTGAIPPHRDYLITSLFTGQDLAQWLKTPWKQPWRMTGWDDPSYRQGFLMGIPH